VYNPRFYSIPLPFVSFAKRSQTFGSVSASLSCAGGGRGWKNFLLPYYHPYGILRTYQLTTHQLITFLIPTFPNFHSSNLIVSLTTRRSFLLVSSSLSLLIPPSPHLSLNSYTLALHPVHPIPNIFFWSQDLQLCLQLLIL